MGRWDKSRLARGKDSGLFSDEVPSAKKKPPWPRIRRRSRKSRWLVGRAAALTCPDRAPGFPKPIASLSATVLNDGRRTEPRWQSLARPRRTRRISPAASPSKALGGARKAYEHNRQVFGLAGAGRLGGARRAASPGFLLAVASQIAWAIQCLMTAVVPAHRCGAVPDFHRVPF